ncbi:uncharacterized protein K444DRAFT_411180 [Hyaloscypha bicolor E]|uniref:Uncharacterized protein n=1 Tax=Hyaloscypha bicolor E TaxID=1095630 RepID=A0A2J6T8P0_9HELO|nr:uncharacterized protein K444DRAFT_411180 [Hyaloscypha bicolor E]PMD59394.1 hypothetical protein K444DRAFT_411180 [Hyaloscypha bicolor E]
MSISPLASSASESSPSIASNNQYVCSSNRRPGGVTVSLGISVLQHSLPEKRYLRFRGGDPGHLSPASEAGKEARSACRPRRPQVSSNQSTEGLWSSVAPNRSLEDNQSPSSLKTLRAQVLLRLIPSSLFECSSAYILHMILLHHRRQAIQHASLISD